MKVDQAGRPLQPKSLSILVGFLVYHSLFSEYFKLQAWKVCFGRDWPKCEDLVGNMAEMARNIVGGH